jgi:diguanylate cyclase (GGDEF)-like protein
MRLLPLTLRFPLLRAGLALLLAFGMAAALAQRNPLDEPRFVRLDDKVAISDGVVTALVEDEQGFIWAGTAVGLVRHDGYQLRPVPIGDTAAGGRAATRFVRSLLAMPGGVLWVGLEGEGVARLDTRTQRWTVHRPDPKAAGALGHGTVRALAAGPDGTLWLGTTGGGLYRLVPGGAGFDRVAHTGNRRLPDDRVHALHVERQGQLWIGTWRGLVRVSRDGQRFESQFDGGGDTGLGGRAVTMLGEGPDGRIWAGTRDGALALIDPSSGAGTWIERGGQASEAGAAGGPGGSASFAVANADEVWVGRYGALDVRDARTGALVQRLRRSLRQPWGLAGQNVVALLRDASGQMWVGTYGGGMQRHTPSAGVWVRRGEGDEGDAFADGDLRSLHQLRNGEIWAGTPAGALVVFDERLGLKGRIAPQPAGGAQAFTGGLVGAITEAADGTVWVGSDTGIYAFGLERKVRQRFALGGVRTRRLLAAVDGSVWAATQDGVHRRLPGTTRFDRVERAEGGALSGNVNALVQSADGTVWVGSNSGLWRVPPGGERLQAVGATADAPLGSPVVLGLLIDQRGQLWVDTNAGLHLWRNPQAAQARFERVGDAGGTDPGSFGANLLEDRSGRIWTHQNVHDPRDGSVQELGVADGVDIGTGWFRAYARLADGRLLFGGSTGMLVVEPDRVRRWAHQPPVVVTDLRINGQRQPVSRLSPVLQLAPHESSLSVEFAALDLTQPDRNRYRFRLEGYADAWTETGADFRMASYGNLPPGRYRLQVQGSNRLGDWSPRLLEVALEVQPAWWQTWWARVAALAALALLVWGLVQVRTGLLRRRQAELEAAVRERTQALEALSRELQQKSAALEASSLTDPLTGLHNRRFLAQQMAADAPRLARRHGEAPRAGRAADPAATSGGSDRDLVFFLIDLDHFKSVNDEHGHAAGDAVLLQVCDRLRQVFREADHVVRWGGEEFLVAARDTSRERAPELAERARRVIADTPFHLGEGASTGLRRLTASIGFAAYPLAPAHPAALDWTATVELADAALYVVKRGGRDGWFGLQQADAAHADALRQAAAAPLADWLRQGGLRTQASRAFDG